MTPYYSAGGITLYHGDCRDVLPGLAPGFDLVFTSPPYNLGTGAGGGFKGIRRDHKSKWDGGALADGYGSHADRMPYAEYVAWQKWVLAECWRLLTPAGAIFYNHKPRVQSGIVQLPTDLNPGLPVRQIVIWARAGGINFSPDFYLPSHEWIVIFARPDWSLKSKGASGVKDVWEVPQESGTGHPAPFPIDLPLRALETTTSRTVLDPFAGSGTTLLAAKLMGREAVGIELDERWCEMAARRLSQGVLELSAG